MDPSIHAVTVDVPCGAGALEGRVLFGEKEVGPGAVIFPPHPFLAGNLDNNVVRAIARALVRAGLPVLLFNYRAVGRSWSPCRELALFEYWSRLDAAGSYEEIAGDAERLESFARGLFGAWHAVGYSFGASLACRRRSSVAPLSWTAIAPARPLEPEPGVRGLLVEPETDGLVELLSAPLPAGARRVVLAGADHFFRGREDEVAQHVVDLVREAS